VTLAEWPFTVTADEFMRRLGTFPLAHQPRERWLYHTSCEILGVLIAHRLDGSAPTHQGRSFTSIMSSSKLIALLRNSIRPPFL
jgi:hypothetical protein